MLIVPELKTVFILVPRTGSGSLYREMRRVYPRAMLLYRHMEAEGTPYGYDRWTRVGFVRHPLMRLWSLYCFMRRFAGGAEVQGGAASADAERCRRQVDCDFETWLLNNKEPWTVPYDLSGDGDWWPVLARKNGLPENLRSQWTYLRPDLGTTVLKFERLRQYMWDWGLNPDMNANMTSKPLPPVSAAITRHIQKHMAWDLEQGCERQ